MSLIPIDHLGRDDLIILLNRVAARLSIVPDNHHLAGTPQTPISYGYRNYASPNDILRPPMATNSFWRPRYEEEHDPWNAHLRSEHSASSSGTAVYTSQTGAQTYSSHSWSQSIFGDAPTTTRLTDAMTYRYSQVDVQNRITTLKAQWPGLRLRVTFVIVPVLATTAAAYAAYGREATLFIFA